MAMLDQAATAAIAASLPSSSLTRMAAASVPMRKLRDRQCEAGWLRKGLTRAALDEAPAGGKDKRAVMYEESKKLLAMQKELLDQVRTQLRANFQRFSFISS